MDIAEKKGLTIKNLVMTALFIALSLVGSHLKIFGSIAFDSLPGFLAALLLGPVYGAVIGFLGHIFTALSSGFPLSLPLHLVIAVSMAITMLVFGYAYIVLKDKLPEVLSLVLTGITGVILNGPVSLAMSMLTLALLAGRESAIGLLALLPILVIGSAANVLLSLLVFKALEGVWNKNS